MNEQKQQQHEGDAGRGVDGVDQKHHDSAAHDAQHARVPGEVTERGPGKTRADVMRMVEVKVST